MTEEEILAERAALYARQDSTSYRYEARYLRVQLGAKVWLFPKKEIRQLIRLEKFTRLPSGVSWESWPCLGLATHGQNVLPIVCWHMLVSGQELRAPTPGVLLVLRHAPVAIRVREGLTAISVDYETLVEDPRPWSRGRTPQGELVARLDRFAEGATS